MIQLILMIFITSFSILAFSAPNTLNPNHVPCRGALGDLYRECILLNSYNTCISNVKIETTKNCGFIKKEIEKGFNIRLLERNLKK